MDGCPGLSAMLVIVRLGSDPVPSRPMEVTCAGYRQVVFRFERESGDGIDGIDTTTDLFSNPVHQHPKRPTRPQDALDPVDSARRLNGFTVPRPIERVP